MTRCPSMNKPALETHCTAMRAAINTTLQAMRINGACCSCSAQAGEQHRDGCAAWPIIRARAEYALNDDVDALL
jgi:hypothetical protein